MRQDRRHRVTAIAAPPDHGVNPMTKVAELHERWMREPEYREAYDRLGPAFEFSRCLIEARTRAKLTQAELDDQTGRIPR